MAPRATGWRCASCRPTWPRWTPAPSTGPAPCRHRSPWGNRGRSTRPTAASRPAATPDPLRGVEQVPCGRGVLLGLRRRVDLVPAALGPDDAACPLAGGGWGGGLVAAAAAAPALGCAGSAPFK